VNEELANELTNVFSPPPLPGRKDEDENILCEKKDKAIKHLKKNKSLIR